MDDKSIMVNLGDEKAKEIAEVIGSKSCNKILNLLADEELTVSDISRKLKMPMNTVDYNVKKLVRAGLIEKASHWWSVKGKKMLTYKVSNKKIIISPRKSVAKVFAWVIGLTGLTALTIREVMMPVEDVAYDGVPKVLSASLESAPVILEGARGGGVGILFFLAGIGAWEWFLIGAWLAIFLFFAITLINDKRHKLR